LGRHGARSLTNRAGNPDLSVSVGLGQ
jgi:hypothetical protein